MKNPLLESVRRLREEGNALVTQHPPDSVGAAVGRERLARADEIERGMHSGWKLTVATTALVGCLSLSEAVLPEHSNLAAATLARPIISGLSRQAEPEVRAAEHTHHENETQEQGAVVTEIAEGARVAWYFGVLCKKCGAPILLFDDKSEGNPAAGFTGGGSLTVPCPLPGCDDRHTYGTEEVRRFTVANRRVHLVG